MKLSALFVVTTFAFASISGCSDSAPPKPVPSVLRQLSSRDETKDTFTIGDAFPVIESVDLDGKTRTLDKSMFGAKYTLVIFLSTWCGFCMAELPHEIELFEKYKDKGLNVVGVNADATLEVGRKAAIDNGTPWVNLYEGKKMTISNRLGVTGWPALFLIDSNGKIIARDQSLRFSTIRTNPDGELRPTSGLDWTLENLFADGTDAR